jgi:hypothetical protein
MNSSGAGGSGIIVLRYVYERLPTFAISGTVTDSDGSPADRRIFVYGNDGALIADGDSDEAGEYLLAVPAGTYRVVASGETGKNDLVLSGIVAAETEE